MKNLLIVFASFFTAFNAFALPECVTESGADFPYRVYDNESKLALGTSGYSTMNLCQKAIQTKDFRIVCAPSSRFGEVGSVIISTSTGHPIGFEDAYFTSVEFCSQAIDNTRGNTVCVPGPNAGDFVSLIDFQKNVVIGLPFSSVRFCKWASLSASFSGRDSYICAMNSKGNSEIFNRATGEWTGLPFLKTKDCYDYLENWRKKQSIQ